MEALILQRAEDDWFQFYQKFGEKFDQKFLRLLKLLEDNPEMGPEFRFKPYRKLIMAGFPVGVFYSISGNRLIISCILDLRQSEEMIQRELKALQP